MNAVGLDRALQAAAAGDDERAVTMLTTLLESASAIQDGRFVVRVARELAAVLCHGGRPEEAVEVLLATSGRLQETGAGPVRVAMIDVALSSALRAAQRSRVALDHLDAATAILEPIVPGLVLATLRHDRAVLFADLGMSDDAVSGFVAAREQFLGRRDRLGVAAADHNLGCVLHDLGNLDDAVEYFQEARNIFLALERAEEAAACDQNLGVVFFDLGRLEEAGRRFSVARHRFGELGAEHGAGECDYNLGVLLEVLGRHDEAARYRARAALAGVSEPLEMGLSGQLPVVDLPT